MNFTQTRHIMIKKTTTFIHWQFYRATGISTLRMMPSDAIRTLLN